MMNGAKGSFHAYNQGHVHAFYNFSDLYLGHGKYGPILQVEARGPIPTKYAIKHLAKNRVPCLDAITIEAVIMHRLEHPNIAQLIDTFQDFKNIYLVLELCEGLNLLEMITARPISRTGPFANQPLHFTEKDCVAIMAQLFAAVAHMHSRSIMHRDICPENIIFLESEEQNPSLKENRIKLIGFGKASKCDEDEYLKTKIGCSYYISPQVLMGWYNCEADVWSCGCILYLLMTGFPPFDGANDNEITTKIFKGDFNMGVPELQFVSPEGKKLIEQCLMKDPFKRCSAGEAHDDPWTQGQIHHGQDAESAMSAQDDHGIMLVKRLAKFYDKESHKGTTFENFVIAINEENIHGLREQFVLADRDKLGHLGIKTIDDILLNFKPSFEPITEEFRNIVKDMISHDEKHHRVVKYDDFLRTLIDKRLFVNEDMCWAEFRQHDKHHTGYVPSKEIADICSHAKKIGCSREVANKIAKQLERGKEFRGGNPVVSFMDFVGAMRECTLEAMGMSSKQKEKEALAMKAKKKLAESKAKAKGKAKGRPTSRSKSPKPKKSSKRPQTARERSASPKSKSSARPQSARHLREPWASVPSDSDGHHSDRSRHSEHCGSKSHHRSSMDGHHRSPSSHDHHRTSHSHSHHRSSHSVDPHRSSSHDRDSSHSHREHRSHGSSHHHDSKHRSSDRDIWEMSTADGESSHRRSHRSSHYSGGKLFPREESMGRSEDEPVDPHFAAVRAALHMAQKHKEREADRAAGIDIEEDSDEVKTPEQLRLKAEKKEKKRQRKLRELQRERDRSASPDRIHAWSPMAQKQPLFSR